MLGVWVVLQSCLESCREDGTYCASVSVLQCYIPATVGVSSCHRVTQSQSDTGDICAPTLLIWSISGPRNFWSERGGTIGGRSSIPAGGDNIWCYITSAHTTTLSIIVNTTHYHQYTNNICMFTILCIPALSFRPPSGSCWVWQAMMVSRPFFIKITMSSPYKCQRESHNLSNIARLPEVSN